MQWTAAAGSGWNGYVHFLSFLSDSRRRKTDLRKKQWGDAPIHSLAAGLLLDTSDLHYFRDFGYRHTTIQHCPANAPDLQLPPLPFADDEAAPAPAERRRAHAEDGYWRRPDAPRENGVGCRCRCDTDVIEVEGKEGGCLAEWVNAAGGWV
jgi:mannosyltransferase